MCCTGQGSNHRLWDRRRSLPCFSAAALCALPVSCREDSLSVTWGERMEVARGKAVRGPWRMNESVWHFVDDPTVAITDQGNAGVAWADHSQKDILFQVYAPDGSRRFVEPVNVSRSPGIFSWLPRVIMASGHPEEVYILWQEIIFSGGTHGGEIFFARSADGGKTFSDPLNLSNSVAGDGKGRLTKGIWFNGSLDLAMSAEGTLYAAWTEYEGALRFSRSTDLGRQLFRACADRRWTGRITRSRPLPGRRPRRSDPSRMDRGRRTGCRHPLRRILGPRPDLRASTDNHQKQRLFRRAEDCCGRPGHHSPCLRRRSSWSAAALSHPVHPVKGGRRNFPGADGDIGRPLQGVRKRGFSVPGSRWTGKSVRALGTFPGR